MINKSLDHGGWGNPVSSWCNPFTGPPIITHYKIINHTDGHHWIRHSYALHVTQSYY